MSLESLLGPAKWVDKQVLTQYSRIGVRCKLDEGKRRYDVALGSHFAYIFLSGPPARELAGPLYDQLSWLATGLIDGIYSWRGVLGGGIDDHISDTKALDKPTAFYRNYNSTIRLPIFIAGAGFLTKYGIDLYSYFIHHQPLSPDSHYSLEYGLGLLALSSSMYIKEIDPKLLGKKPAWQKAYHWLKEKASGLLPHPLPSPIPQTNRSTLTDSLTL